MKTKKILTALVLLVCLEFVSYSCADSISPYFNSLTSPLSSRSLPQTKVFENAYLLIDPQKGEVIGSEFTLRSRDKEFFILNPESFSAGNPQGVGAVLLQNGKSYIYGDFYKVEMKSVGTERWTTAFGLGKGAVSFNSQSIDSPSGDGGLFMAVTTPHINPISKMGALMPTGTGAFFKVGLQQIDYFVQLGGIWGASGAYQSPAQFKQINAHSVMTNKLNYIQSDFVVSGEFAPTDANFFKNDFIPQTVVKQVNSFYRGRASLTYPDGTITHQSIGEFYKKTDPLQGGYPTLQAYQVTDSNNKPLFHLRDYAGYTETIKAKNYFGMSDFVNPTELIEVQDKSSLLGRWEVKGKPHPKEYQWTQRQLVASGREKPFYIVTLFSDGKNNATVYRSENQNNIDLARAYSLPSRDLPSQAFLENSLIRAAAKPRGPTEINSIRNADIAVKTSRSAIKITDRALGENSFKYAKQLDTLITTRYTIQEDRIKQATQLFARSLKTLDKAQSGINLHSQSGMISPYEKERYQQLHENLNGLPNRVQRFEENVAALGENAERIRVLSFKGNEFVQKKSLLPILKSDEEKVLGTLIQVQSVGKLVGLPSKNIDSSVSNFNFGIYKFQDEHYDPAVIESDYFREAGKVTNLSDAARMINPMHTLTIAAGIQQAELKKAIKEGRWGSAMAYTLSDLALSYSPITAVLYQSASRMVRSIAKDIEMERDIYRGDIFNKSLISGIIGASSLLCKVGAQKNISDISYKQGIYLTDQEVKLGILGTARLSGSVLKAMGGQPASWSKSVETGILMIGLSGNEIYKTASAIQTMKPYKSMIENFWDAAKVTGLQIAHRQLVSLGSRYIFKNMADSASNKLLESGHYTLADYVSLAGDLTISPVSQKLTDRFAQQKSIFPIVNQLEK